MDFYLSRKSVWSEHVDARILPLFEGQTPKGPAKLSAALDAAQKRKVFAAKKGQVFETESNILVGLGARDSFKPPQLLRAIGAAYPALKRLAAQKAAVDLSGFDATAVDFATQGLLDAAYCFDEFKSEKTPDALKSVVLVSEAASAPHAMARAQIIASAVRLCRDLDNQPANIASPQYMAAAARKLSQGTRLSCTVLDEKQLAKKGFKAHLAVGQGSQNPPRLVILEYRGGKKTDPWLAFVGKGITFDTGGISIKPSADMDKMKFDKSGACAVLSAMSALSKLGVKRNVVGIAAFAENMP
ncbi:MAG: M17 family peptidase N-terminal domain-containing protein, partial [Candidatus Micrarchaeota archaeon]|nr:M17 family peptidase N-terminal domain-containing protein [Candidatus Micrarchaeota archaeon]